MHLSYLVLFKKLHNNVPFCQAQPLSMDIDGFVWSHQHCSALISLVQSSQPIKKYSLGAA